MGKGTFQDNKSKPVFELEQGGLHSSGSSSSLTFILAIEITV